MSNPYLQPSYSIPIPMNQPGTQPIASAPSPNEFPLPYAPQVPQGGWPIPNMICPPGLEYLMGLDHLFVKQKVEMLEVVTGWETRNKYNVMNIRGEQVYYVCEQSNCCSRFCCGTYRSCEFKELEVYSGGILLGSVVQDWTLFRPWFSILNANGDTVLKIKGPLLRFCVEVDFKVKSADGTQGVGMISKHWSGITREYFTDTDNFGISFPIDLDVKIKAVLLGACLLIDFMYFETSKE